MEINLDSDFQAVEGFLRKIMEFIESRNGVDARAELARKLLKEYKSSGQLYCRIVGEKYASVIEDTLIRNKIPMMSCKDSAGNTIFMLPEEKTYHYDKLFQSVYMRYPDFYKQITPENFYTMANEGKGARVIEVTFNNETDANIFINKAYADGKGFVTTDIKDTDGQVKVYLLEKDLVNPSENRDFVDALIDTEVSRTHQNEFRTLANAYDNKQLNTCLRHIANGEDFCLYNACSTTSNYLQFQNGRLSWHEYDKTAGIYVGHEMELGDLRNPKDRDALKRTLGYHMATIHYATVADKAPQKELEAHLKQNEAVLKADYFDKQVAVFCKYFRTDEKAFDVKEIVSKLEVRPEFSMDFLKQYEAAVSKNELLAEAELTKALACETPVISMEGGEIQIKTIPLSEAGTESVLEEDWEETLLSEGARETDLENEMNEEYGIEGLFVGFEMNAEIANEHSEEIGRLVAKLPEETIAKAAALYNMEGITKADLLSADGRVNDMTANILSGALLYQAGREREGVASFVALREKVITAKETAIKLPKLQQSKEEVQLFKDILAKSIETEESNKQRIEVLSEKVHGKIDEALLENPFLEAGAKLEIIRDALAEEDMENNYVASFEEISIKDFGRQLEEVSYEADSDLEVQAEIEA